MKKEQHRSLWECQCHHKPSLLSPYPPLPPFIAQSQQPNVICVPSVDYLRPGRPQYNHLPQKIQHSSKALFCYTVHIRIPPLVLVISFIVFFLLIPGDNTGPNLHLVVMFLKSHLMEVRVTGFLFYHDMDISKYEMSHNMDLIIPHDYIGGVYSVQEYHRCVQLWPLRIPHSERLMAVCLSAGDEHLGREVLSRSPVSVSFSLCNYSHVPHKNGLHSQRWSCKI